MQRGVKLLSVSLTLLCSVPGSARLCFSILTQKPLCTPITLHRLTTSTKMSLMKSLGDNSSRCRLSASIHLRGPSPLWFLSSSVALGGIWDSAVAVYFSKKNVWAVLTQLKSVVVWLALVVITHFGTDVCCGCLIYSQTNAISSLRPPSSSHLAFLVSPPLPGSLCLCIWLNIVIRCCAVM